MKRIFTFGLMLTAVFALTNCTEELVDQTVPTDEVTQEQTTEKGGIPFQIHASFETDTKTEAYMQGTTLKTKWKAGDEITVFYEIVGDPQEKLYKASGTFKMSANQDDIDKGIFSGFLPAGFDVSGIYNWYFVYGATYNETTKKTTVDIGYATIEDNVSAINHLAGINCPMYGSAKGLSGSITPAIRMRHLANLIELTIKNQTNNNTTSGATPGDVVINNVGISYSSVGSKKNTDALVGTFTLNIPKGELIPTTSVKNTMNYVLTSPVTLSSTNATTTPTNPTDITVYFVTAPMDLQTTRTIENYYLITNSKTTITIEAYDALSESEQAKYLPNIKRQDNLSFSVNGSVRPAHENTYPGADGDEYASGSIQKLTLPIKELRYPFASDAFNVTSQGRMTDDDGKLTDPIIKVITLQNYDPNEKVYKDAVPTSCTINGHTYDNVYILGGTGKATYKTITKNDKTYTILDPDNEINKACQGKVIIKGFLRDIMEALPVGFYATRYNNLPTAMTIDKIQVKMPDYEGINLVFYAYWNYKKIESRTVFPGAFGQELAKSLAGLDFSNGITRELLVNGLGFDASTITFAGLVDVGSFDNVSVMYEDAAYKYMSDATDGNVASYVNKFSTTNYTATMEGLLSILQDDTEYKQITTMGNVTKNWSPIAKTTGNAIYERIVNILASRTGVGNTAAKYALKIFNISDVDSMMHFARDMEFEITITTYPNPSTPDVFNPIVVWGMDAKGPGVVVK